MKKILLSIALVLPFAAAQSQSLEIKDYGSGAVIPNNQDIYFYLPPTDVNSNPTLHAFWIDVHNLASSSVAYKIKRTIIQQVAGCSPMYCQECGSGLCFTGPMSSQYTLAVGGACEWDIRYNVGPTPLGTSVVRYTAFNTANVNDSTSIVLHYIVTPAAVPAIAAADAFLSEPIPNPASGTVQLQYQLNTAANASLELYNLLGEKIQGQNLANASGNAMFSVAELPAGIYYAVLKQGQNALVTRKLVVTR